MLFENAQHQECKQRGRFCLRLALRPALAPAELVLSWAHTCSGFQMCIHSFIGSSAALLLHLSSVLGLLPVLFCKWFIGRCLSKGSHLFCCLTRVALRRSLWFIHSAFIGWECKASCQLLTTSVVFTFAWTHWITFRCQIIPKNMHKYKVLSNWLKTVFLNPNNFVFMLFSDAFLPQFTF